MSGCVGSVPMEDRHARAFAFGDGSAGEAGVSRRPLVLVGETRSRAMVERLAALRWGRMFCVKTPAPYPCEPWALDNGAYVAWINGTPFPEKRYLARLERAQRAAHIDPYFAVCPDIVAQGQASLDFSLEWRTGRLRHIDWPWYLAVQDGMEPDDVRPHLHLFAGLFLGGTSRFKDSTGYRWRLLADANRLRLHYGRASSVMRLISAYKIGADSLDSAMPIMRWEYLNEFANRWDGLNHQKTFEYEEAIP